MSTPTIVEPTGITLTDSAANKIYALIKEENNPALKLRVFITGGGCSGFQYSFAYVETPDEDDTCIKKEVSDPDDPDHSQEKTVTLVVDPMSYPYLAGATVDYEANVNGEQFVISNPNAKTTCGCGSSFSV